MKVEENIDLLKDVVAKKIFTKNEYGKMYAARIISEVIGMKVKADDLVYKGNGTYINFEMNTRLNKRTKNKNRIYLCQLYLRDATDSEKYGELNKIIQINIDNYDYYKKNEFMYKTVLKEIKYNIIEDDFIEIYHINLDRLRKEIYNKIEINELKKLLYLFVCKEDKILNKLYEGDEVMGKVFNISKELREHFDELLYYNREELEKLEIEDAKEEGREEGIIEGVFQSKLEIAKNMLEHQEPLEKISQYTNLTIDEIKEIK